MKWITVADSSSAVDYIRTHASDNISKFYDNGLYRDGM